MNLTIYFPKIRHFIKWAIFLILFFTGCNKDKSDSADDQTEIETELKGSISQFGITWYFDREYESGQFANGDWWVLGPVTIIKIDPASTSEEDRIMNGSMINPSPQNGNVQGYDNAMSANTYSEEYNCARPNSEDLSEENPLHIPVNSCLVSSISMAEPGISPQL